MTQRNYTVKDILDNMATTDFTHQAVSHYAAMLDRECFLCEERFGARSTITWQLRTLTVFMLNRIIPLLPEGSTRSDDATRTQLKLFISSLLSEDTLSHEIGYASFNVLRESLMHIEQATGVST